MMTNALFQKWLHGFSFGRALPKPCHPEPIANPALAAVEGSVFPSRLVFADGKGATGSGNDKDKDKDEKDEKEEEKKKKEKEEAEKEAAKTKEEKEKKKEKEEMDEKKKKAAAVNVDSAQKTISERASLAIGQSEQMKKSLDVGQMKENEALSGRIGVAQQRMEMIRMDDENANKPLKAKLDDLVARKKITREDREKLLDLDPLDQNFEGKWNTLTAAMPELQKDKEELLRVKGLKIKEGEKDKENAAKFAEVQRELFEISSEMTAKVEDKMYREHIFKIHEASAGFPLKVGQILTFQDGTNKRFATIKDIQYEEIEITDEKGNSKQGKTGSPIIIVESVDPLTQRLQSDKFSLSNFFEWINRNNVTENIHDLAELEKNIGYKVKKGEKFEYHQLLSAQSGAYGVDDLTIEIKEVDELNDKPILLDNAVTFRGSKQKTFTFGEFARWFKQNEAMKPIEDLKSLRQELYSFREVQNQIYNRDPREYVPIEIKEGETMQYGDRNRTKFNIKKVDEVGKKIEFESGDKMTYTNFLRWVKKNDVEKINPELAKDDILAATAAASGDQPPKAPEGPAQSGGEGHEQEHKPPIDNSEAVDKPKLRPVSPEENSFPKNNRFKQVWNNTYFMSLGDFGEMGKTLYEFGKRKLGRWKQERVGKVGEMIFGSNSKWGLNRILGKHLSTELGAEYKGVWKHAEQEEVSHHEKHLEYQGYEDIIHEVHEAPNKDIFKAAVSVLAKKGQFRWDDRLMWNRVNKLFKGDPCWVTPSNYLNDLEKIFDKAWGQNSFRDFRQSQDSGYKSTKGNWLDQAKRLENAPDDGLRGEMKRLLHKHLRGEYVNGAQYEAYLEYAIVEGKMGFEDKMFFLIMGVGVDGGDLHHPHSLLSMDRVAEICTQMNKVPLLEFFMDPATKLRHPNGDFKSKIDKKTGKEVQDEGRPDQDMFRYWANEFVGKGIKGGIDSLKTNGPRDWEKCGWKSSNKFEDFVGRDIAWNWWVRIRAEKAAGDTSRWDHDDMDRFVQLLSEEQIENITNYAGGARQQVSTPGMKNAFVGLNNFAYIKMKMIRGNVQENNKGAANDNLRNFVDILRSFIRVDAIVDRRFKHNEKATRFSYKDYDSKAGADDSRKVISHVKEMRQFIEGLSQEFGIEEQWNIVKGRFEGDELMIKKQNMTVPEFGKLLEGQIYNYVKANGIEATMKLFDQINEKNKDMPMYEAGIGNIGLNIKGTVEKPEGKTQTTVEEEEKGTGLQSYMPPAIQSCLKEIEILNNKLAETKPRDVQKVKKDEEIRYQEILKDASNKTYRPRDVDESILRKHIEKLKEEIRQKEGITTGPIPEAGQQPTNDNKTVQPAKKAA